MALVGFRSSVKEKENKNKFSICFFSTLLFFGPVNTGMAEPIHLSPSLIPLVVDMLKNATEPLLMGYCILEWGTNNTNWQRNLGFESKMHKSPS